MVYGDGYSPRPKEFDPSCPPSPKSPKPVPAIGGMARDNFLAYKIDEETSRAKAEEQRIWEYIKDQGSAFDGDVVLQSNGQVFYIPGGTLGKVGFFRALFPVNTPTGFLKVSYENNIGYVCSLFLFDRDQTSTHVATIPSLSNQANFLQVRVTLSKYSDSNPDWDTIPTEDSGKPVTSAGIFSSLQEKADKSELQYKADLVDGKVPAEQLPPQTEEVVEVNTYSALPVPGEAGRIYITKDDNKLYRWAGVSYEVLGSSGGGTDFHPMVSTTWAALKEARDSAQLLPGLHYRITDYNCTVSTGGTSANHPFDLVVMALTDNSLSEEAEALLHAGDTYFASCNLGAWEIKYSLDNDTSRFLWADPIQGKGVIYFMKDEWNNRCSYDFKNVLFDGYYTFHCSEGDASLNGLVGECYNNDVSSYFVSLNKIALPHNVFRSSTSKLNCYSNILHAYCYNNTFLEGACYNMVYPDSRQNTIQGRRNILMPASVNNKISTDDTYLGPNCSGNTISGSGNHLDSNCVGNTITGARNTLGVGWSGWNIATTGKTYPEKQDVLISGENIKTIGGMSILGGGDLDITGTIDNRIAINNEALSLNSTLLDIQIGGTSIVTNRVASLSLGSGLQLNGGTLDVNPAGMDSAPIKIVNSESEIDPVADRSLVFLKDQCRDFG